MATEFAFPAPSMHYSPPSHYTLYGAQAQPISPIPSATSTPLNASPTSPRSTFANILPQPGQLRKLRTPTYRPAVLRATEPPTPRVRTDPNQITPPGSVHSSFESLQGALSPIMRRGTGDSKFSLGQISEREFCIGGLADVTDSPTRDHWKPDHEATICDSPTCTKAFTFLSRRHHCRRCGNIFCDAHSARAIPLDQDANYHPSGARSRACEFCFREYRGWEIARSSRSNSEGSGSVSEDGMRTPTTPIVGSRPRGAAGVPPAEAAQSVPRDWNWSTF